MSEVAAQTAPQGGGKDRMQRLEDAVAQLAAAVNRDRDVIQGEINAVTLTLQRILQEGHDSSGITTSPEPDSTGITATARTASDREGDADADADADADGLGFTGWADRADEQDWAGLIQWVDWLSATYELGDLGVRPCWPAHGAAVEEMAALKMAWEQAIGACVEMQWVGTEALAYWHDRYLPGTMQRLQSVHGMKVCKRQHEERPRPLVTDTRYVVIRSTGHMPEVAVSPS